MKKFDVFKFVIFLLILVPAIWSVEHLHVFQKLTSLRGWIQASGGLGILAFIGIFGAAFSFGVPAIALTVFAATIFGTFTGFAASSAGATLGIIVTFILSRFLARDMIKDLLGKKAFFIKVDSLTEKYGWYMVAIIRFIPFIPAEFVNYAFGLTKIKFLPYVATSWLCLLPWLYVYIAGTDAYLDYKLDGEIHWPLVISSVVMLALLVFAGVRFMKLIEPELQKREHKEE
jgi:uncharacterized membrane protein YdjX (TVP38/TMEM64 family)